MAWRGLAVFLTYTHIFLMHEATLLVLRDSGVFSCSGEHGEMAYFFMGSGMCFVNALCDVLLVLFASFTVILWLSDPMCFCPGSQHQS